MDTLFNIGIVAIVIYLVVFVAMAGLVGAFFISVWRSIQRDREAMRKQMERYR